MNPKGGGPAQGIRNLIPSISALGHTNEVVCLDSPDSDYGMADLFPIYKIGPGRGALLYCPNLKGWLEANIQSYDVVLIHGLWQYHSLCVTQVVLKLKKRKQTTPRVFVMPHGMLDPWFQRDKSRRIKAWRNWVYWKLIEHRTISNAEGILFTCQRELELAKEPFRPYRPKQELNVGYGVAEPPSFTESMRAAFLDRCNGLQDRKYLLFVSRIHPKKGVDFLIEAYSTAAKNSRKFGKTFPSLVIAGPLDGTYAQEMQRLATTRGLLRSPDDLWHNGAAVYFPGMLQGDAKWGALYGCDAFVLPSHQENFGIAVVEALACSKPVLISNQINIFGDINSDGAAIVGSDDLSGTVHLLKAWFNRSKTQKEEMGINARNCYTSRYLPTAAAKVFAEVIS